MDVIERVAAILEIHMLKARYFRCMDTRDWDGYESVFTEDCECDVSVSSVVLEPGSRDDPWKHPDRMKGGVYKGAKNYTNFVAALLNGVRSVHHGHMPEIEILSPTTARGVWAMEDFLDFPEGAAIEGKPISRLHGHGHYHETYERVNGEWKIKSLKITRLRETRI